MAATFVLDWNNRWLNTSVAYGASATLIGTVSASFSPASALSGLSIGSINLLGSNYSTRFSTISTNVGAFPIIIRNNGLGESSVYNYSTVFNNNVLHSGTQLVSGNTQMSTVCALLSAGSSDDLPAVYTASDVTLVLLTALGDAAAPSGVSGFTATAGTNSIILSWTNSVESDVSGTLVKYSTTRVPSAYTDGTTVYNGTAETYTHTGLDDNTTYYYSAFAYDNVGKYDTLSDGATGSANPVWNIWPDLEEHTRLYELGLI